MPDRPDRTDRKRVVVVGAGIAGLATAWYLQDQGLDVTVLDADDRAGGKVRTTDLDGTALDVGPDTFLGRVPWAVQLCRELGLAGELLTPATTHAWLWSRGRLQPLPDGLALGVPLAPQALARSGIIGPAGLVRAGLDVVLPQIKPRADPSVADVIGGRLGREVLERLVDPLVGGINAGRSDRLSMAAVAPDLFAAHRRHRSLILGLRAERRKVPPSDAPLFLGLRGGMETLTSALAAKVDVSLSAPVEAVTRTTDGRLLVTWSGGAPTGAPTGTPSGAPTSAAGAPLEADAVVLAVPARRAAAIVRGASATAAAALDQVRYASVAVATLAYRPDDVGHPLDGSGFLVPRVDGHLLTACTWFSSKWPHVRPGGLVLLRCSAGRDGDERANVLDDVELVARMHAEAAEALGLRTAPVESVVTRWPDAFPQYDVGHLGRVGAAERGLARELPGVLLAGASYRGVGIASCVRQANEAARAATSRLTR
ncbi:MAG: protoporphyrinogen oxidase [Acidimicrobiia bacterium]|nr:protoporphyrinogen oxidase [Acidimicrobiia bacterium]